MKKGKIVIVTIAILIAISMVTALVSVLLSNNKEISIAGLTDEIVNASVTLGQTKITINSPITFNKANNQNKEFDVDGKAIIKEAANLLGKNYNMGETAQYGGKGGVYSNVAYEPSQIREIDCSGLVAWSLKRLGYEFDGPLGNKAISANNKIPLDGNHFVTKAIGTNLYYFNEVGTYIKNASQNTYSFNTTYPKNNISASSFYTNEITCNKSNLEGKRINVLKVNDPITNDFRYYNYYDKNGNKKVLPMGTIVYSHGGTPTTDHSWIYIGDLGTSDSKKAADKLISMGIINENQKQWVEGISQSHHWRIESHGGAGVRITNNDPNMGDKDGTKTTGTIWAFQVANDEILEGEYHLNISKRSSKDNLDTIEGLQTYTNCIGGAEFNLKLYRNNGENPNRDINITSNEGKMTRINWDNPEVTSNNSKIKIDDVTIIDKILVEETKAPENYNLPETNKFELRIYKKLNGSRYELNKIEVYKEDGSKIGEATYGYNSFFINKQNNIALDMSNNAITVTILDTAKEGMYNLEIEKIDAKTKTPIPGIEFMVKMYPNTSIKVTTNKQGLATLESKKITIDDYEDIDHYLISENTNKKYATLKGELELYVKKSESEDGFIATGISNTTESFRDSITYNVQDTLGNNIICTARLENNCISLTMENTPYVPPILKLNKVDSEDNEKFLLDTDMTIIRKIINENEEQVGEKQQLFSGKLKDLEANLLENGKTFVYTESEYYGYPEKYVYEIYENEPAYGYLNILKGKMYIEVTIWCTPNINVSKRIVPIQGQNVSNDEISDANNSILFTVNNEDRTITGIIKNPQENIPFELDLYKHELNSDKAVSGINFNVSKDGKNIKEEGFTSQASAICLDKVDKVLKGKTYTYIIEETNTNNNIVNKIAKTEVKVTAREDGTISANISRVMKKGQDTWQDYNNEFSNLVVLEGPDENNKVTVKIANSMYYEVKLIKRDYETQEIIPGAKFTINQISPNTKQILPNEENEDGAITDYTFIETEANSNSEYIYEISEIEVPNNYLEILKDIKINLHIKTDELGNIKPLSSNTNSTGTYYELNKDGGLKYSEKNELKKYINLVVDTNNNNISLNIYNKAEQNDYNIQIMKVDKKTGKPLSGAIFSVTYPDASSRNDLETNNQGIVSLYNTPREITKASDLYTIREIKAPDGGILLNQTDIIARVNLAGVTNSNELKNATVDLTVSKAGAEGLTEIEGLDYNIVGNVIQIIIPNEMPQYIFKLKKQNLKSEPVNGIKFFVQEEATVMENKLFFEELQNGEFSFIETAMGNKTYTYLVKEQCGILGYDNLLEGMDLKVHVVTDSNGRVKEIHEDDNNYTRFEVIQVSPSARYTVNEVKELINLELGTENIDGKDITVVNVTIKNPYKYKMKLEKQDLYGNVINNKVRLELKENETSYPINTNNNLTSSDIGIGINETQEWTIRELDVEKPYYNIFENKYIKVITKWDLENNKIKVESLKIYNNDNTEIPEDNKLYEYVSLNDVYVDNNTYTVPIIIRNPFIYRLKVTKYETDGKTEYTKSTITVNNEEIIGGNAGEKSFYTVDNIADLRENIQFTIRETASGRNHINIFEKDNKYLSIEAKITEKR